MIRLDTTTRKLQIQLDGVVTTNQLPVVVSFSDKASSVYSGASQTSTTNNTTAVDICVAPGASTVRDVDYVSVWNRDVNTAVVSVIYNDNSTLYVMTKATLSAGDQLTYTHSAGWTTHDSNGNQKNITGASASTAVPGGADGAVQYNNAGTFAGAIDVSIHGGDLLLASSTPTTPPADNVKLFGRSLANRMLPAVIGPSGLTTSLQPSMARNKVAYWNPPGNATTVPGVFGITAPTTTGTATARNVAVTNVLTRMKRLGYVSSGIAGNLAGHRITAAQFTTGDGTALGGFMYVCRFGISDASLVSGARMFVGMSSATNSPSNVEPSTLTNSIGIAQLSSSGAQLYLVYGGSVAQTAIALGATDFPVANNTVYEIALFAPVTTSGTIHWQVTNVGTNATTSGTISGTTAVVPGSSTLMTHRAWRSNNATNAVVGIDVSTFYIETDQ